MDTDVSSLELALQKRLDKLQPKTQTAGFLRSVVERQSMRIDAALSKGYSYDEIAIVFNEQGIKCKGSTLKKYHLMAKKKDIKDSPIPELPSKTESTGTAKSQAAKKKS
ncbi:hypothetical protein [Gloeothece verrucosa]|uniref:Uncharacterized protein n=1 Tax=Gloeothece verrucosa (strain PCC 7822) TaxID=497965 RepID=E0UP02_GLOV7|nr:hypothetical protein [Gloeothece verrucosa]ADN18682.1 hypothetical protein Cyan7822_6672 [Gloeothece verrucosa PCC 7822]